MLLYICNKILNNTQKIMTMKTYAAWTRKQNSNDSFCTQYIKAKSLKEAKQLILESGREIEKGTKIYLYNN